jgi:hypothetical protein
VLSLLLATFFSIDLSNLNFHKISTNLGDFPGTTEKFERLLDYLGRQSGIVIRLAESSLYHKGWKRLMRDVDKGLWLL